MPRFPRCATRSTACADGRASTAGRACLRACLPWVQLYYDCVGSTRIGRPHLLQSAPPQPPPAASPMALLEIENVTRRFGDFTAVDGVTLSIAAAEFFTLLGPSGCGKTTLLRMIA